MSHRNTIPPVERSAGKEITTMPVTVLLVDDHDVVRKGLRSFLGACPQVTVVGEAGDAQSAVDAVTRHTPDVVVIEPLLPLRPGEPPTTEAGIRTIRRFWRTSPHSRVIVLTNSGREDLIAVAAEEGVLAYLLKEGNAKTVLYAILAAKRGEPTLHPQVARHLVSRATTFSRYAETRARLTAREIEVLQLVARGYTHTTIASELAIAEHTVNVHIIDVLAKTASQYRPSNIRYQGENAE